jgi:superfamily II DNA or RNA helicase
MTDIPAKRVISSNIMCKKTKKKSKKNSNDKKTIKIKAPVTKPKPIKSVKVTKVAKSMPKPALQPIVAQASAADNILAIEPAVEVKTTMPIQHGMLTKQGYAVLKSTLNQEDYADLKAQLTVKPKVHPDYDMGIESYPVYTEDNEYIYVPRFFGDKKFGKHSSTNIVGSKINIEFKGRLQDEQKIIVDICHKKILEKGGGVISVPCGAGKTVMVLDLICKLGLKALIIVPKSCLLKQTVERIQQFTTARVGIIRQKKVKVDDVDIVVGMIHSIALKDYDSSIFKDFGVVAYDECHRTPSRILSNAFKKAGAIYTIGLSATPRRKDGLIRVMFWNIGNIIFKKDKKKDSRVFVHVIDYDSSDKRFSEKKQYVKGSYKPSTVKTMTDLIQVENRNKVITEMTVNLILENTNGKITNNSYRKILILSERIDHLKTLKKMFDDAVKKLVIHDVVHSTKAPISGLYIGGMKQYLLDYSAQSDVIYGSYGLAKEGLDIGDLNVLIMASPQKDIEQAVGRILRKQVQGSDIFPIVVDVCDTLYIYKKWFPERLKFYESQEYIIQHHEVCETEIMTAKKKLLKDNKITSAKYLEITDKEVRRACLINTFGEYYFESLSEEILEQSFPMCNYLSTKSFENIFDIDYSKYVTKEDSSDDDSDSNIEDDTGDDDCDGEDDDDDYCKSPEYTIDNDSQENIDELNEINALTDIFERAKRLKEFKKQRKKSCSSN